MRSIFLLVAWLLGQAAAVSVPGLTAGPGGTVQRDGQPFRGIGVNYFDAFSRTLKPPPDTNYDAGFRELARRGIPFARFSAGGFWPADWSLYQTNRAEYFTRLDAVVRSAERHGVGLIPSLFWHVSTVPDLVGEPVNRWGDTNSRTHAFLRTYTREVVTRYAASPAIWAWEFGNEYNLAADLPNAAQHRPQVVPRLGTPAARTAEDELTHAMVRVAVREFALEVRRHDPHRLITSGHSIARPSAWHQIQEKSWRRDTPAQFSEVLAADHPAPADTLSLHWYEVTNDLARVATAMTVSRATGRPLFVGEFGVPGPDASRDQFATMLTALETNGVPLGALWVFDFAAQSKDWNVNATNSRNWQLDELQRVNARLRPAPRAEATPNVPTVRLVRTPHGGLQPQAIVDGNGTTHLIYFGGEPKAGDLFYVRQERGTTNWAEPLRINSVPGSAIAVGTIRGAQLALGRAGRLHVAWNGARALPGSPHEGVPMLYTRLDNTGRAFEPQRDLMQFTGALDGGGTVAADARGNVFVLWHGQPPGNTRGEEGRALFLARSTDDGATFARERPVNPRDTGACACCGVRALTDAQGRLYTLYRAAGGKVNRDATLLVSSDCGDTFSTVHDHPWRANQCPMSSASIATAPDTLVAAWETSGQIHALRVGLDGAPLDRPFRPDGVGLRRHPSAAIHARGDILLAWTEGTGWQKGGSVAWQLFTPDGTATTQRGRSPGVPVWGLVAAVADADGGFVIFY